MNRRVIIVWCVPFLLVACQYDPFVREYATTRPDAAQLVGRYRPDDETTQQMKEQVGVTVSPKCELILRPDGTFVIRELPRCWFVDTAEDCLPGTQDLSGTWQLRQQEGWWAVTLVKHSIENGVDHRYDLPVPLRGKKPPYILELIVGDPDLGTGLAFARQKTT